MRLLTDNLSPNKRQAVRFVIVGSTGTALQYALYYCFLLLFDWLAPDASDALSATLTTTAYTLAFILETITNYILTALYTFSDRITWKNLGGFGASRISNYLVQIIVLQTLLFVSMEEKLAGFVTMIIAGIINFFVVRFFFNKK